mmetsp:Transcript_6625/g.11541  ORF Transcript_6625/g.11541 Transcript_6625/m.11541 type:complete len:138 (+) Transcript_6625:58-471(+)
MRGLFLVCLLIRLDAGLAQSTPSPEVCANDATAPAECCLLVANQPCFIQGFYKPGQSCSVACQKKYQQLGWECYNQFHLHVDWINQQKSCDPQEVIVFSEPLPTRTTQPVIVADANGGVRHLPLAALYLALAFLFTM